MKKCITLILLLNLSNFVFGQNTDRQELMDPVEKLVYQLQFSRPQQSSSTKERDEFLSFFSPSTTFQNFIFPEIVGEDTFCLDNYSALNFYSAAYQYFTNHEGVYVEFSTDVGKAGSPERFDGTTTYVNFNVKTHYNPEGTLFSELKSRVDIIVSNDGNGSKVAKISSIEVEDKNVYAKRKRKFSPELHAQFYSSFEKPEFSEFDTQLFSEPTLSNEIGFQIETIFGKKIQWGLGIGYYQQDLNLNLYGTSMFETDGEGDQLIKTITGTGLSERSQLLYVSVPFYYAITPIPNFDKFRIRTGLNALLPILSSFSGSGSFDYAGYYPELNFSPIEDVPELGIYFDEQVGNSNITYRTNPLLFLNFGLEVKEFIKVGSSRLGIGVFAKVPFNKFFQQEANLILSENNQTYSGLNNFTESNLIVPFGVSLILTLPKFKEIIYKEVCPK